MAVPAYLQEIYSMTSMNTADVADIITQFSTDSALKGWTESPAGTYTCPSDSGRTLQVVLSKVDAQTLSVVLKDQSGNTVYNRRALIDTGGPLTALKLFMGTYGFYIDINRQGVTAQSFAFGTMCDPTPESKASQTQYVFGHTAYDSSSANTTNAGEYGFMYENGAAASTNRVAPSTSGNSVSIPSVAAAGGTLVTPGWVATNISNTQYFTGRWPGMLYIWGSPPPWSRWLLPIDTGTVGTFHVCRRNYMTSTGCCPSLRIA